MVELDGSRGEGGGQILRTALAMSALTGRPFKLVNIRAGRAKPGLAPQHLASVKAAAQICGGRYKGGSIGSMVLYFEPEAVKAGHYTFVIGTAGATALVMHTVYLPLALRGGGESTVTVTGGTHVSHSPCFHYLQTTWAAHLAKMGIDVTLEMTRPGFYPRGGGEIRAVIRPCPAVRAVRHTTCPAITTAGGFSAAADLPERVARDQARRMSTRLKQKDVDSHLPEESWANGPGSVVAVIFRQLAVPPLFFALGERGRPAAAVADEATDDALAFRAAGKPVDPHAADQILLPLVFAPGESEYHVSAVTRHLTTNADTIRGFVDRGIEIVGEEAATGVVRVAAAVL